MPLEAPVTSAREREPFVVMARPCPAHARRKLLTTLRRASQAQRRSAAALAAPELLERVRDRPVHRRVHGHAHVARADLHVLAGGVEAGVPVHDPVGARVHADAAHVLGQGSGVLLPELRAAVALEAGSPEQARRAERAQRAQEKQLRAHDGGDRQGIELRRAQPHHAGHYLRPAGRRTPRELPPPALARGRAARALANVPPRLWPMSAARCPWRSTRRSRGASSRSRASPEQPTFERIPALLVWWPVRRSQRVMSASESSPARKPGTSSTGWP